MLIYPGLPPELKGAMNWRTLRFFSAGAIIASVTIGSGETLFASRGGAIFGYALLWCFVGGAMMKGLQVCAGARHFVLTGAHPMEHWGQLPGPRNWVPILIGALSLLCFPFWLAGLPRILGETVNWIFGFGVNDDLARIWGTLAIVTAIILTWIQSYDVLEKAQTAIIGLLLASLMAACIASQPDWLAALVGTLVPTIPHYAPWIDQQFPDIARRSEWVEAGLYLGAIGGGTYDYIGYLGLYREKRWGGIGKSVGPNVSDSAAAAIDISDENLRCGRRWLLPVKIDVGVSFTCVLVFTIFFVVLGAVILHPEQLVPQKNSLLNHQAEFLTQFHPALLYGYQVGIFMAFWGTIYGAYELYTRTTYECLRPISAAFRAAPIKKFRLGVLLYTGIGGLALLWTTSDPIKLVVPAAIIGGVFTCGLWCFLMIWTDRHFLPRPLRMSMLMRLGLVIAGSGLTGLGLKGIWGYTKQLLS